MKTKSRRYLSIVFRFCIVGLLLLAAFSWGIDFGVKHSDSEQTGKINGIINHSIDPDIMIFGSSVGEVGISPAILSKQTGASAFNCSLNGTRFLQYKGLIDEFRSYSRNNKYVVMVETYFSFEKVDALAFPDWYLAQINNQNLFSSLYRIQPDMAWKCRYIPFYKYVAATHVYYKNAVAGWINIIKRKKPDTTSLGYAPVNAQWQVDADEVLKNMKPFTISLEPDICNTYSQTINELEKSGRKVIIVLTPMYTEKLKRITDMRPLRNKLAQIASATGARFMDFTGDPICADKKFFYNSNHLNEEGAVAFSNVLADSLQHILRPALFQAN